MKGKISNREFVTIYTTVYNMCLQNKTYQHDFMIDFVQQYDHLINECKPKIFNKINIMNIY